MRRHLDPHCQQLNTTLSYLGECSGSQFDWTSAATTLEPADHIKATAADYFRKGALLARSPSRGEPTLLQAVKDYFHRCAIPCEEENILIASSTFQIVADIYDIVKPKGKVLIPTPSFGYFIEQCGRHNMRTALLPTDPSTDWKVTPEALEQALTIHKPAVFLFTNPVNPTGSVYTKDEIEALATVLKRHDVMVISDEIFRDMALDPIQKPYSLAAVEGMADKTITLSGIGKSHGLSSIYVSYCCASMQIVDALLKENVVGHPKIQQLIAAKALEETPQNRAYLVETMRTYRNNAEIIMQQLNILNKSLSQQFGKRKEYIKPVVEHPAATNLYLLNFEGLRGKTANGTPLATGLDVARFLQREAGVAMVPGEGFFLDPNAMIVRLTLSRPPDELKAGFAAIKRACEKLVDPPRYMPEKTDPTLHLGMQ